MNEEHIPESRAYRHLRCDTETVISGPSFEVVSNPLADMSQTWCLKCQDFFPIAEYEWVDSGEKLTDYYVRHGSGASMTDRFLCSKRFLTICIFAGLFLGVVCGWVLLWNDPLWVKVWIVPLSTGIGGVLLRTAHIALCKPIVRRVCGVSDTRLLT